MQKVLLLFLSLLLSFSLSACANKTTVQKPVTINKVDNTSASVQTNEVRIRITINNQQVIVRLYDSPTSRDLLTMLPLTLPFKDYVSTEKISYLPRKLITQGTDPRKNTADDFTYYAPWGNLAIFYKGKEYGGNGLIVLGRIETGKSVFADLNTDFIASIERIE